MEQIFASHLEDWPALLKSLRIVGDDVRTKARTPACRRKQVGSCDYRIVETVEDDEIHVEAGCDLYRSVAVAATALAALGSGTSRYSGSKSIWWC